jgi:hypothetical protein
MRARGQSCDRRRHGARGRLLGGRGAGRRNDRLLSNGCIDRDIMLHGLNAIETGGAHPVWCRVADHGL